MFSHTIKAQPYNMPLLARFLRSPESGALGAESDGLLPRLIDYELIAGEDGKRTVAFGWFAGGKWSRVSKVRALIYAQNTVAGALESLSALAHAHLELGVASPFLVRPLYLSLISTRAKQLHSTHLGLIPTPQFSLLRARSTPLERR